MNEKQMQRLLRQALAEREAGRVPAFAPTLAAAERSMHRTARRQRMAAGLAAAAAVAAVAFVLWPSQQAAEAPQYLSEQALLDSTAWVAPSDVLLPRYEFDIYQDLPVLNGLDDLQEGTFL